jgi:hypothetical protein
MILFASIKEAARYKNTEMKDQDRKSISVKEINVIKTASI